jgi:hypothetical protein
VVLGMGGILFIVPASMAGFRIPLTSDMLHIGTLVKVASPIVPEGTELEIPVDSFGVFRAFDDDGDGHFDFPDQPVILPVSPQDFCKMFVVPRNCLPTSSVDKLDHASVTLLTAT